MNWVFMLFSAAGDMSLICTIVGFDIYNQNDIQHNRIILFVQFSISYKKQLIYEGRFASCCKSYPLSCWQHCIAEVKLKITDQNLQNKESIKSYILKGADILERIDALCM